MKNLLVIFLSLFLLIILCGCKNDEYSGYEKFQDVKIKNQLSSEEAEGALQSSALNVLNLEAYTFTRNIKYTHPIYIDNPYSIKTIVKRNGVNIIKEEYKYISGKIIEENVRYVENKNAYYKTIYYTDFGNHITTTKEPYREIDYLYEFKYSNIYFVSQMTFEDYIINAKEDKAGNIIIDLISIDQTRMRFVIDYNKFLVFIEISEIQDKNKTSYNYSCLTTIKPKSPKIIFPNEIYHYEDFQKKLENEYNYYSL